MVFYFLIFFLITLFALFKNSKNELFLFIATGIGLFFIAGFRGNIDRDHEGYIEYYYLGSTFLGQFVEPSFIIISNFVRDYLNNVNYLFVIYALIAVAIKLYAIYKITTLRLLTLVVFFSLFFLLHEMTQIRVAVASGILLLCVHFLIKKNYISFFLASAVSIFFHFSSAVILILVFFKRDKLQRFYSYLIPVAYVLAFAKIGLSKILPLLTIPVVLIQTKFGTYQDLGNDINLFNGLLLFRIFFSYFLIRNHEILQQKNEHSILLIKAYVIGVFSYIAFSDVWGVASRLSELMQIGEIILIPFILNIIRDKNLAFGIVISISFAFLCFVLFQWELLKSYFPWL
jgi:hypothetical protein